MSNPINAHLQGVGNVEDVISAICGDCKLMPEHTKLVSTVVRELAGMLSGDGHNPRVAKVAIACLLNSLLPKSGRLWMVSESGDLSSWPVSEGELRGVLVDLIA